MRATAAAILAVIAVIAGVAVWAQAAQDQQTFRAGVRLIEVDAIVTDRNGNPVRDLTRDDFEIVEEGRPQEISTFISVDIPIAPTSVATPALVEPDITTNASPEGRLYVLLLDAPSTATPPGDGGYSYTMRAKQVAHQFVNTVMQPGDEVAVVHVQGTFTDSQAFTTSRQLIEASVERYGRGKSGMDSLEMASGSEKRSRALDTYKAIEDVAKTLGTIRGRRKAIIWIGGQIDIAPERQAGAAEAGSLSFAYRDAMRVAVRNNVAIYPIDPSGFTTEFGQDEMLRLAGLRAVAEDTGAAPVVSTNNFGGGFQAIMRDLSTYYLLGYSPQPDRSDNAFHSIQVRVKRPGVVVRARRSYYADKSDTASRPPHALPNGVSRAAADALGRPLPTQGLRLDVFTTAFKTMGRERSVLVGAYVDARSLQLDHEASLAVSYQILNLEGRVVTGHYKVFDLKLQPGRDRVDGLRFLERVSLAPGRYELRIVAEQPGVALGSAIVPVAVPALNERLAMSRVVLATSTETKTIALTGDPTLRAAAGGEPTVLRRFTPRDTLMAFAELYSEPADEAVSVVGTLATNAGTEVARVTADAAPRTRDSGLSARGYRAAFDLRNIAPGSYVLTIEAASLRHRDRTVRQQIPISIAAD